MPADFGPQESVEPFPFVVLQAVVTVGTPFDPDGMNDGDVSGARMYPSDRDCFLRGMLFQLPP
eukprot:3833763-Alexandrium_andersonii.AAC.1